MIGCEFCQAVISEPCRSPIAALDCKVALVSERLASALVTISEQGKMIAALEADLERVQCELDEAELSLTSERQRREEAEALLKSMAPIVVDAYATNRTHTFCLAAEMIRQHFRKYEPIPADREEERNGNE